MVRPRSASSQETRCLLDCLVAEGTSKLLKVVAGEEGEGEVSSWEVGQLTDSTLLVICLSDLMVFPGCEGVRDSRGITSPDITGGDIVSHSVLASIFMKSHPGVECSQSCAGKATFGKY